MLIQMSDFRLSAPKCRNTEYSPITQANGRCELLQKLSYSLRDCTPKNQILCTSKVKILPLKYHNCEIPCSCLKDYDNKCLCFSHTAAMSIKKSTQEINKGVIKREFEQQAIRKVQNQVLNSKLKHLLNCTLLILCAKWRLKKKIPNLLGNTCSCNSQVQKRTLSTSSVLSLRLSHNYNIMFLESAP